MNDKVQTPPANKPIGSPCLSCPPQDADKPIYSQQLQLTNITNIVALQNIPYTVMCEKKINAKTDTAGKSERIYTEKQEELSFLVGKLAISWQRRDGNFGSLKNTDERTIKLKTDLDRPNSPTPLHQWIRLYSGCWSPQSYWHQ